MYYYSVNDVKGVIRLLTYCPIFSKKRSSVLFHEKRSTPLLYEKKILRPLFYEKKVFVPYFTEISLHPLSSNKIAPPP